MISYDIIHHIPGRIRLRVPLIKKLVTARNLPDHIKKLSFFYIPAGIKDIKVSIFAGSLLITYEPKEVDIMEFIQTTLDSISSNEEIHKLLKN
ncbi:MAG: HMA2 domain-containing protein [Candidatus Loosdrechtia sp.]|uniref:HMA2 domain-containing protein n=1 Tax=Candidatus Loosdrechtia sp. TaxID=3101272 RepID=UPI003A77DC5F|nr:MAG: hypothetical protein QY305_04295 [Candidatus Jettenia sp. AMX2]